MPNPSSGADEFFLALDARDDPRSQNREALVRLAGAPFASNG